MLSWNEGIIQENEKYLWQKGAQGKKHLLVKIHLVEGSFEGEGDLKAWNIGTSLVFSWKIEI